MVPRMRNNTQLTPPSYRPPQGVAPFSYVLTVFKDALNTIDVFLIINFLCSCVNLKLMIKLHIISIVCVWGGRDLQIVYVAFQSLSIDSTQLFLCNL